MTKTAKPSWLTEPEERKKELRILAKSGVSRHVIRIVTGWSNNQMAGFTNRAGFAFDYYKPAEPQKMRTALLAAGFLEKDVDSAFAPTTTELSEKKAKNQKPKHLKPKRGVTTSEIPKAKTVSPSRPIIGDVRQEVEPKTEVPTSITAPAPVTVKERAARTVSTKLSGNPHTDCGYSGRCGYERLPDSTSCGRPGHDK